MTNTAWRALVLVGFLVAAIVTAALASGSTTAVAIALMVGGIACVLLVSLAFYEVGRSEDRARERERRRP